MLCCKVGVYPMKTLVFYAVLMLVVCVHDSCSDGPCVYTLTPTYINSGCPTQSRLDVIYSQIASNVDTLVSAFQACINRVGSLQSNPATSCQQIYLAYNGSLSGQYWLVNATGTAFLATCRFDAFTSFSSFNPNITNGFAVLSSLNMADTTQQCPSVLKNMSSAGLRLCYKGVASSCASVTVSTLGLSYQTVCGKVAGYEIGSDDAFQTSSTSIESTYVDGISITYGRSPRRHIWTYAAGVYQTASVYSCPCTGTGKAPPSFVGSNYYCESGNPGSGWSNVLYSSDLLWDGKNCGTASATCCTDQKQPWFCKRLSSSVVGDLEMRVCTDEATNNEDIGLQSFEFYVQ